MISPGWFADMVGKYKAGISHSFLLYFNVRDYVDGKRELTRYVRDEFLRERNFGLVVGFDVARGLRFPDEESEREFRKITTRGAPLPQTSAPSRVFPLIDLALSNAKTALFINHQDLLTPSGGSAGMDSEERAALIWLCEWSASARVSAAGSVVIMTSGNLAAVAPELLSSSFKIEPILVGLPDEDERLAYIRDQARSRDARMSIDEETFAALSSGLSKKSIRDIMLKSEAENAPISFEFIKEKKRSVLQKEYGDVLEFIYPETGFDDIGGMDAAKRYLIRNVVEPIRRNDLRRVPMGVLLCGPSGTGKTLLVNALARESGFNCVKIDMARILGQYMGESEKNFKKCLLGAQSQQPVIVFVDEIDTAFKRGDDRDSGVSRNIFGEFLQFTANTSNRGKVIFIAATNRPDLLDPALKRAGRFDKKIPILLPDESERASVFRVLAAKYGFKTAIDDYAEFARDTNGYTGAEIETAIRKAYEIACDERADAAAPPKDAQTVVTERAADAEAIQEEARTVVAERASDAEAIQEEARSDGAPAPSATVGSKDIVIDARHLSRAVERCRPNTGMIELMTRLAIEECDDLDLLPSQAG